MLSDDRGAKIRGVTFVEARRVMRAAGEGAAFNRELTARVPRQNRLKFIFGVVLLLAALVCLIAAKVLPAGGGVGRELEFVGGIGVFIGLLMVMGFGAEYESARQGGRVRVLVSMGWCGSCTYDLRGGEAEADGCVVCPECGAAWRVGSALEG